MIINIQFTGKETKAHRGNVTERGLKYTATLTNTMPGASLSTCSSQGPCDPKRPHHLSLPGNVPTQWVFALSSQPVWLCPSSAFHLLVCVVSHDWKQKVEGSKVIHNWPCSASDSNLKCPPEASLFRSGPGKVTGSQGR